MYCCKNSLINKYKKNIKNSLFSAPLNFLQSGQVIVMTWTIKKLFENQLTFLGKKHPNLKPLKAFKGTM